MSVQSHLDAKTDKIAHNIIGAAVISSENMALNSVHSKVHEDATEFLNEIGTTDRAIGDATAEIMLTTPGKLPNEMYYMEETGRQAGTPEMTVPTQCTTQSLAYSVAANSNEKPANLEIGSHSTIFLMLSIALLILLLLCCITACMIARAKRRKDFFGVRDIECDPTCSGISQPLLQSNRISETTSKTSSSSMRN